MQLSEFLQGRLDAGESRSDIGRRVGVHPSYITRWLAGTIPETKLCRQIADAYDLPHETVLKMAGHYTDGSEPSDTELDVWMREVREIYRSFERSRWRDLTAGFRAFSSLSAPPPKENEAPSPKRNGKPVQVEESLTEDAAQAVNLRGVRVRPPVMVGAA